jgi:hypothetical protein
VQGPVIANFFWHGPRLGLYERACLSSFVKAGLHARLYSFNSALNVPDGVQLMDASAFARPEEVTAYTQGGTKGSIAAFSDIFRYRLFQVEGGWYFDTDMFCLQGPEAFQDLKEQSKGLIVGEEGPDAINAAALYVSNPEIAKDLESRAQTKGFEFKWGEIGPALISQYVKDHPENATIVPPNAFYPVHYRETAMLFRPEARAQCIDQTSSSVCIHLWNEIMRRWNLPQNLMPCEGSFLHMLFSEIDVHVDADAALPAGTFETLHQISPIGLKAAKLVNTLRPAKERALEALSRLAAKRSK